MMDEYAQVKENLKNCFKLIGKPDAYERAFAQRPLYQRKSVAELGPEEDPDSSDESEEEEDKSALPKDSFSGLISGISTMKKPEKRMTLLSEAKRSEVPEVPPRGEDSDDITEDDLERDVSHVSSLPGRVEKKTFHQTSSSIDTD